MSHFIYAKTDFIAPVHGFKKIRSAVVLRLREKTRLRLVQNPNKNENATVSARFVALGDGL